MSAYTQFIIKDTIADVCIGGTNNKHMVVLNRAANSGVVCRQFGAEQMVFAFPHKTNKARERGNTVDRVFSQITQFITFVIRALVPLPPPPLLPVFISLVSSRPLLIRSDYLFVDFR